MISHYQDRQGTVYEIAKMDDSHLLNAHRYFAMKRLELQKRVGEDIDGADLLRISLLINSLWQEINKRELLKY